MQDGGDPMPRRPSVEVMERDARAADLYRRGLTYRQIATEVGFRSPQSVGMRSAATPPPQRGTVSLVRKPCR